MNIYWAVLLGAVVTGLVGQTLLKAGASAESFWAQLWDWHTILGLCLYGGAAILYIIALRSIPMSVALPCTALSYVAAVAIGHFVYAEPVGPLHLGGLGLIFAGVLLLATAQQGPVVRGQGPGIKAQPRTEPTTSNLTPGD